MIESILMPRLGSRVITLLVLLLALGACSNQGSSPEQLLANAKEQRDKGKYRDAIVLLKNVLEKSPQNAEARYLLGMTFNDVGDFRSAEIELRKAIALALRSGQGQDWQVADDDGSISKGARRSASGPELQQCGTSRNPDAAGAVASIGLSRIPEGRELLEQALAKQPEFADALLVQAGLAARGKKLDESAQLVERALASEPKNVDAWLMKGDLARISGDQAGALAAYRTKSSRSIRKILALA